MNLLRNSILAGVCSAALALAACGGGGGSSGSDMPPVAMPTGVATVSSGSITAFGSVFVNGREVDIKNALVFDDDTGTSSADTSQLEVGMQVDVKMSVSSASSTTQPAASEIHLRPLARGIVDASDTTAGTLAVMGQAVQLTADTHVVDRRACLTAATSPCTAVTGQAGLAATTGTGAAAVAGTYVGVHGYLFSAAGGNSVVATLLVVGDAPTASAPAAYKAEGVVTAASGNTFTIGGLTVDLTGATCYAGAGAAACSGAYRVGQIVSVFSPTAPALPASSFTAKTARLHPRLATATAGLAVELEGVVSNITASPASFSLRGVVIDASALAAGSLPAAGDLVRVLGTVSAQGSSVTATSVVVLRAARAATYGLEGDFSAVAAGSAANTYVLTLLGQNVAVDSSSRLADLSAPGGRRGDKSTNPFNITSLQTYLTASTSKHLLVRTQADASGNLKAASVLIVPASTAAGVAGPVDSTPAPANGSGSTATTFAVHGVPVSASPAAIIFRGGRLRTGSSSIQAGDFVQARGTYAAGTLTVAAPGASNRPSLSNFVFDLGPATAAWRDCF